eukprot:XP_024998348.1 pre-mRNA-splicing factor cwc22-like [Gallus gallus]
MSPHLAPRGFPERQFPTRSPTPTRIGPSPASQSSAAGPSSHRRIRASSFSRDPSYSSSPSDPETAGRPFGRPLSLPHRPREERPSSPASARPVRDRAPGPRLSRQTATPLPQCPYLRRPGRGQCCPRRRSGCSPPALGDSRLSLCFPRGCRQQQSQRTCPLSSLVPERQAVALPFFTTFFITRVSLPAA